MNKRITALSKVTNTTALNQVKHTIEESRHNIMEPLNIVEKEALAVYLDEVGQEIKERINFLIR